MSEAQSSSPVVINGPFQTDQQHTVTADFLQAALNGLVAAGNKIAYDAISDHSVRENYQTHIRIIVDEVKAKVINGEISALEGARYCNELRDKLFIEYRQYTSAQGVAWAEKMKLNPRGFDYYLNYYSARAYNRDFVSLSVDERAAVYFEVMSGAARARASVTSRSERLAKYGKGMLLITGAIVAWEIASARDHVKEAARQGNVIAAGMLGGGFAGFAVSFLCGPAEPVCAFATVAIGAHLGATAGEAITNQWDDALRFFRSFVAN